MKNMFKKYMPLYISVSVILVTITLYFLKLPFMEFVELKTFDLRFIYRGPLQTGDEIALITIDEKSLDEIGRWQWPRSVIAKLMRKLKRGNPKVIGLDMVFAEPDQHSELKTITSLRDEIEQSKIENRALHTILNNKAAKADTDALLAHAIKDAGNVVAGYFYHKVKDEINNDSLHKTNFTGYASKFEYPFYTLPPQLKTTRNFRMTEAQALETNLTPFTSASKLSGYFNIIPDRDGIVRTIDLATRYQDYFLIPLSLQVLRHYLNYPEVTLKFHEGGIEKVQVGNIDIPCDFEGKMIINYRGGQKTFKYYSFTDVIHDRIPLEAFTNKIVLVGATATGIYDIRITPFDKIFPGVEVHAHIIDTILKGDFLSRSPWIKIMDVLIIIGMGLCMGIALPRCKALLGALFTAVLFAGYILATCFLFTQYRLLVSITYPVVVLLLTYTTSTVYYYMIEEREKRRIRDTFQRYLAPSVVEEILKNPDKLKLGGEEKELTILFSDIRNFTSISETLSPTQLEQLLNEYFTAMTAVIFKNKGTLDKYMGDAIMAFFGAPLDQPEHHLRACFTAVGMVEKLNVLQQKWKIRGLPHLSIGIGINSGLMVVGNMGSDSLFDYTVIGDNVNLGSRLESLNKQYGTTIIISEFTYHYVKDAFTCRELDLVQVKGKEKAVTIYELVSKEGISSQWKESFLNHYEEGLKRYRERKWEKAVEEFSSALKASPNDVTTRLYIKRCEMFSENPPPDEWKGIFS